ncbi:MAG TPA: SPOR domain-containing protein [Pyrinomonadaceae bacterium]|nr:SPOR domain-containing protein [Pyrinomonadaceae bacterium]
MNYEFSLSKTASISLIAGSVFISVLLFGAGLVVGSQWLVSSSTSSETTAKNEEPDVPTEPVLKEEKPLAPKSPAAPNMSAPAAPAKAPAAQQPAATFAAADIAEAAAAPPANGEVKIIQEAGADAATDQASSEPDYVTVQIGVFRDEKEADRLLKEVERKGYAPSFFSGRDAEARQWYAVRIGAYSDKHQASNAAANFTKQEKMKAVVRPLGSL